MNKKQKEEIARRYVKLNKYWNDYYIRLTGGLSKVYDELVAGKYGRVYVIFDDVNNNYYLEIKIDYVSSKSGNTEIFTWEDDDYIKEYIKELI